VQHGEGELMRISKRKVFGIVGGGIGLLYIIGLATGAGRSGGTRTSGFSGTACF
jgi:hypothetical protein